MFALKGCPFESTACTNKHQEKDALLHSMVQSLSTRHFILAAYEFHTSRTLWGDHEQLRRSGGAFLSFVRREKKTLTLCMGISSFFLNSSVHILWKIYCATGIKKAGAIFMRKKLR